MELLRQLEIVSRKLVDPTHDTRGLLLDEWNALSAITDREREFPPRLQPEVRALRQELDEIRPPFPSQRQTSVLYDREGLGQKGKERAKAIAIRFVTLMKELRRLNQP